VLCLADSQDNGWQQFLLPGLPPSGLVYLHDLHLFADLWQRVLRIVRDPVQVQEIDGLRHVHVVGSLVVLINPTGELTPFLWTFTALGKFELEWTPAENIVIQGLPHGKLWLQRMAGQAAHEVLAAALAKGIPATAEEAGAYAAWAFDRFARQLPRCTDLRLLRRRIASALSVEPHVVRLAGQVSRTERAPNLVMLDAYNSVVREIAAVRLLQAEQPSLMPIFAVLSGFDDFPRVGGPAARLKRFMKLRGLSEMTWRLLVHADRRLLRPLTKFYAGEVRFAALEHLTLLDRLQLPRQPPAWFIDRLIGSWGDPGNRWASYVDDVGPALEMWRHVGRLACRMLTATTVVVDDFDLICRWICQAGSNLELDKRQKRGGWSWLVKGARAWDERRRLELTADLKRWSVPFDARRIGEYEFAALADELELWDEARAMRNCVDRFGDRCQARTCTMVKS
jgi:hypothetical protein